MCLSVQAGGTCSHAPRCSRQHLMLALATCCCRLQIYACVGCKVCDKLQELNGQYGYSCTMAGGCVAPYPDTTKGYYVSCGANGPNVLPGHVAVPGQVWAAIKDIRCAPVS